MTEQHHAVVRGGRATTVLVMDAATAVAFRKLPEYADAQLVDCTAWPAVAPGWRWADPVWLMDSAKAPTLGQDSRGTVTAASTPVLVDLGDYGVQVCARHSGYTPTVGDRVTATLTPRGWEVADKVQG